MPDSDLRPVGDRTAEVVQQFRRAYVDRNVDKMMECFADDAVVIVGVGTFRGPREIRRFLAWDVGLSPSMESRDVGIGLLIAGSVAVQESVIDATYEGIGYQHPVATMYEIDGTGKIGRLASYYDKLAINQQIAAKYPGGRGWIFRKMVDTLVSQGRKGLEPAASA